MNRTLRVLSTLLAASVACGGAKTAPANATRAPSSTASTWATPAGWKHETIPFPLDFAPTLAYQGSEELRFMPGFFDANAPGYWSYAFAWDVAAGSAPKAPEVLAAQLQTYFDGLATAVADGKFAIEPSHLELKSSPASEWSGAGTVFDAFQAHQRVTLSLTARIRTCRGRDVVIVSATPSADAAIRDALASLLAAYPC